MTDILSLPGWVVRQAELDEPMACYCITIERETEAASCPLCGTSILPYRYGYREKMLADFPLHMRPVQLVARRRRYQCRICRGTFLDETPSIDPHYEATSRLVEYIQAASLHPRRTFSSLASDLGVSETFIRSIFLDHIAERERTYAIETPSYLGVDEIVLGTPRFVAADLHHRRLIDILEKRTLETVKAWFARLSHPEAIQVLVMDMWQPYKIAAIEQLPGAKIVIDRFHVVRRFHEVAESIRQAIRASLPTEQRRQLKHDYKLLLKRERDLSESERLILESWTGLCPLLHSLFHLKEEFHDLYEATDEQEAWERYMSEKGHIPPVLQEAFIPLQLTIEEWGEYIFNYWSVPRRLTNGFVEAKNRCIRDANRTGYGLSLRTLRAKMLFSSHPPAPPGH